MRFSFLPTSVHRVFSVCARSAAALLLMLCIGGCQPISPLVTVHINNKHADVDELIIDFKANGTPKRLMGSELTKLLMAENKELPPGHPWPSFAVRVPAGTTSAEVQITGLHAGCQLQAGTGQRQLSQDALSEEFTVALSDVASTACITAVEVELGGFVTAQVAGSPHGIIDCTGGTCMHRFPKGEPVRLSATSDKNHNFGQWSGCPEASGNVCILPAAPQVQVKASFTAGARMNPCAYEFERITVPGLPNTATWRGIWGPGNSDIWIVGEANAVAHLQNNQWATVEIPSLVSRDLYGVWGVPTQGVVVVGDNDEAQFLKGSTWTEVRTGFRGNLKAVWADAGGQFWMTGHSGSTQTNCWAGYFNPKGAPGLAYRFNREYVSLSQNSSCNAVWGVDGNNLFAVGYPAVFLRRTGTWTAPTTTGLPGNVNLSGIFGAVRSGSAVIDYWMVGGRTVSHSNDGMAWTDSTTTTAPSVNKVWTNGQEVWVAGNSRTLMCRDIIAFAGASWVNMTPGNGLPSNLPNVNFNAIYGFGSEVWVAGDAGVVLRGRLRP